MLRMFCVQGFLIALIPCMADFVSGKIWPRVLIENEGLAR